MRYIDFFIHLKPFYILLLSTFLLFSGCSFKGDFSPSTRDKKIPEYTHVGLYVPEIKYLLKNDIDEGAMAGMGYGALSCLEMAEGGANEISALFVIFCLPFGIVGGMMGGAGESFALDDFKKEEGTIHGGISRFNVNKKLQDFSVEYAQENQINISYIERTDKLFKEDNTIDYSLLASKGIDTIIIFKVDEALLDETGIIDTPVYITLQVSSELVNTVEGTILSTVKRETKSDIHNYKDWVFNDFELLKSKLNALLKTAVEAIIDEHLLLYYPTLSQELLGTVNKKEYSPTVYDLPEDDVIQYEAVYQKAKRHAPYYVLSANYPKPIYTTFGYKFVTPLSNHTFSIIKEQQPILKWESFPWSHDEVSKERFSDIVYDLKIYKYKGPLIYERKRLKENKHQVETVLDRDTKYLWTVRARFNLDDKPHFTEWGGLYRSNHEAWMFGDKCNCPLSDKKYFYYAFIIEE